MVEEQLITRGIADNRVIDAFYKLERHRFVPQDLRITAYADNPLPIGKGQTISQPYMAALMTECLRLTGSEKVLEIGTGSGYQTAILAELSAYVYSVERVESLALAAEALLTELGYKNFKMKLGDGTLGWEEFSPFDRIIVTAACPIAPPPLTAQLKEGGKIVLPLSGTFGETLTVLDKKTGGLEKTSVCGCVFVPLIGDFGYRG